MVYDEEVVGQKAAAQVAGVAFATIQRAVKTGRLQPVRREMQRVGPPMQVFTLGQLRARWPDTCQRPARRKGPPPLKIPPGAQIRLREG